MKKQGGKTANTNGNQLESLVKQILEDKEYQFINKNKFLLATRGLEQKLYCNKRFRTKTIYSAINDLREYLLN